MKNECQDTHYLKQIARLEIEVENNKLNNERFSKIVEELISLRGKLREEENYELSDTIRDIVGALKISLATILILAIWHKELLILSSLSMAFLMICAQYFHIKVKNPFNKFIPSLSLLILCLLIAANSYSII